MGSTQRERELARAGDHRAMAMAWRVIDWSYWEVGQAGPSCEASLQVAEHARRAGDRRLEVLGIAGWATGALLADVSVPEAIRRCQKAYEECSGYRLQQEALCVIESVLQALGGDFDRARRLLSQARSLASELDFVGWNVVSDFPGTMELLAGDLDESERLYRSFLSAMRNAGNLWDLPIALAKLAGCLVEQGRLEEARALLDEAKSHLVEERAFSMGLWFTVNARLLIGEGRAIEAIEAGHRAIEFAD